MEVGCFQLSTCIIFIDPVSFIDLCVQNVFIVGPNICLVGREWSTVRVLLRAGCRELCFFILSLVMQDQREREDSTKPWLAVAKKQREATPGNRGKRITVTGSVDKEYSYWPDGW